MRPSEYLLDVLKEGARLSIFQINTMTRFPSKNEGDDAAKPAMTNVNVFDLDRQARLPDGTLSLRSMDKTAYIPYERAHTPSIYYLPRRVLPFDQIASHVKEKADPLLPPVEPNRFGPAGPRDGRFILADEFDGVGVILAASPRESSLGRGGSQLMRQNLFVADQTQNIIAIHITMHQDCFPPMDFFQEGRVLAFSNLKYRYACTLRHHVLSLVRVLTVNWRTASDFSIRGLLCTYVKRWRRQSSRLVQLHHIFRLHSQLRLPG
jgi:hypothetical protein